MSTRATHRRPLPDTTVAWALSAPVDEPFVLSDQAQRLYRKELIYEGTFRGPGGRTIQADRALLEHWAKIGGELIAAGFRPPLPLEHTTNPEASRGEIQRFETGLDSKGRFALFGLARFADSEAEKLASRTNVSIYSPPAFEYAGKRWAQPITHVALTSYPVVPFLEGFQAIAASYLGEIKMAFDWSPIAEALELPDDIELNDDNAAAVIVMAIQNLKGQKPEKKPEEKPAEKPPVDKPEEKPLAASANPVMQGLLRDNRKMKLDQLQREGRLTKAARDLIEKEYLSESAVALSLGGGNDGFDRTMEVLQANPPCVPLKEKTGAQTIALSHHAKTDAKDNPLLADAERRAAAAKNRR